MSPYQAITDAIKALVNLRAVVKMAPSLAYPIDHIVKQLLFLRDRYEA